jgi:hypothetical protein
MAAIVLISQLSLRRRHTHYADFFIRQAFSAEPLPSQAGRFIALRQLSMPPPP